MLQEGWAASFSHCWTHCMIAYTVVMLRAYQTSSPVTPNTTEALILAAPITAVGREVACMSAVCQSAFQPSDYEDDNTGYGLGAGSPQGDCGGMCEAVLDGKFKEIPIWREDRGLTVPMVHFVIVQSCR